MKTRTKRTIFIVVSCLLLVFLAAAAVFIITGKDEDLLSEYLETAQRLENNKTGNKKESVSENTIEAATESALGNTASVETASTETGATEEIKSTESDFIIRQKAEASYEKWLAAEMIVAISLQYSDYEFKGIYLASETEQSNFAESKGVYIIFEIGEEEIAIQSKPLEREREEAGTKDLYTKDLGFATFDEVMAENVNIETLESIEMEELSKLISQSMLVSVYEH